MSNPRVTHALIITSDIINPKPFHMKHTREFSCPQCKALVSIAFTTTAQKVTFDLECGDCGYQLGFVSVRQRKNDKQLELFKTHET